jgi:hypothetical protein
MVRESLLPSKKQTNLITKRGYCQAYHYNLLKTCEAIQTDRSGSVWHMLLVFER